MVASHTEPASTNVVSLPNLQVADLDSYADDYALAVRAFLAAASGQTDRRPGSAAVGRRSGNRGRARRPILDLPCQRHDPNLWFAEAPDEVERAKALCALCPVRLACLAVAVDHAEVAGVWGGHIFERGQMVAQKRPRGRPRKNQTQRAASLHSAAPASEEKVMTQNAPTGLNGGSAAVRTAAARLYDAERALDSAHESRVDTWIAAAKRRLQAAVTDYLAVATLSGLDRQDA